MAKSTKSGTPDLVVYRGIQYRRDLLPADVVTKDVLSIDEWRKAERTTPTRTTASTTASPKAADSAKS